MVDLEALLKSNKGGKIIVVDTTPKISKPVYFNCADVKEKQEDKEMEKVITKLFDTDMPKIYTYAEIQEIIKENECLRVENKTLKELVKKTEDPAPLYSFRFNEERKSVTLYKAGEKVQFVKCHEEDKFSWKIGLGVALYKEVGKGKPDVEYMKSILNWKMFYTYVVAYALNFDRGMLDRLDIRVKRAKLYKEININDINL